MEMGDELKVKVIEKFEEMDAEGIFHLKADIDFCFWMADFDSRVNKERLGALKAFNYLLIESIAEICPDYLRCEKPKPKLKNQ